MVFFGPNENAEFVYKIHIKINSSIAAPPKGSILSNDIAFKTQNSAQILNDFSLSLCTKFTLQLIPPLQPSQKDQYLVMILPSKLKIQLKFSTTFLCCTYFTSPRFRPTFFPSFDSLSRRTSGLCLGTFRAVNFLLFPHNNNSHCITQTDKGNQKKTKTVVF